ncbi:MAG: 2-isopropylmalate synthase [Clostridia bacterium]|nr:2-isopropylmalate synthase [Clostridia bacterium]
MRPIAVLDTTLRDGEQTPGVSLNVQEKLQIARQLARMQVDVLEAGFPASSAGDFAAVQAKAAELKGAGVAALNRTNPAEIRQTWEALKKAERPRIHTFLASSDIHLEHKLKISRQQALEQVEAAVKTARQLCSEVEFSAEDASRSDPDFLAQMLKTALNAGARILNIPDTVGYALPQEFAALLQALQEKVGAGEELIWSVHCHNDLGLAVANSLAALEAGAGQVEGTLNGIGERAGNAALEEIILALKVRQLGCASRVKTEEIYRTSKLVSSLTGIPIQPNKAIVGQNAFAHESGIHQDGVLKKACTYEIMDPQLVGRGKKDLVLGKSSGRHAFAEHLQKLGFALNRKELEQAFLSFKDLADRKRVVTDEDLEALVEDEIRIAPSTFELQYIHISSGSTVVPTATVGLLREQEEHFEEAACGNGPVDAICHAVDRITGLSCNLLDWGIRSVTSGRDALGEVVLRIAEAGQEAKVYSGKGLSTDILEASAKAYVNAVNKLLWNRQKEGEA